MLSPELINIKIDGIVQIAKWISYFILFGATLSVTVSMLKLTGAKKFKLGQLEFSLSHFVYAVLALTAVHAYLSWIFVQRATVIDALGKTSAELAWDRLINSEAFVFYNMRPRVIGKLPWPFENAYVAQSLDTAFWFTLLLAMALIVAVTVTLSPPNSPAALDSLPVLRSRLALITSWFHYAAIACALASANWIIGTQWAIAASRLAP
ncbi:hypothetical protein [Sinorhizobium meliloti]|uniref:hypothetical protein n=1 Tax=Rhizobium meliloti TaxID=382 RepID=UPI002380542A|nr:hypothetical protein [Sinorhizobium meliloti]MDE3819725.1 hypothetical protein [Sinorhizobium meliloti]